MCDFGLFRNNIIWFNDVCPLISHRFVPQNVPTRIDVLPPPNQRSHSAAPNDYHQRRGSLSPPPLDDYSAHSNPHQPYAHHHGGTLQQSASSASVRFQSRSATATPTGSPKKRQLPQVPGGASSSRSANVFRDRFSQEFDDQGGGNGGNGGNGNNGRFSRHRPRQAHQQTYRSTGMGGWERHYAGLSDSDLTMRSTMEPRLRARGSLSPDKDFMGDFGDSDMESVVSVTSSAFSTQSERPHGSRGLR